MQAALYHRHFRVLASKGGGLRVTVLVTMYTDVIKLIAPSDDSIVVTRRYMRNDEKNAAMDKVRQEKESDRLKAFQFVTCTHPA